MLLIDNKNIDEKIAKKEITFIKLFKLLIKKIKRMENKPK